MAYEVEGLDLRVVSTNAESVASELNSLVTTLERLKTVVANANLSPIAKQLQKFAHATQGLDFSNLKSLSSLNSLARLSSGITIEPLISELQKLSSATQGLDFSNLEGLKNVNGAVNSSAKSATRAAGAFGKLGAAFKRIIFYRVIRSIIRAITSAIKEGVNAVYEYSQATGGEFASQMDAAASSMKYFKNSIGAALVPLISALLPTLIQVTDAIARFNNALARLFAAWSGKTTAIQAVKQQIQYKAAVDDTTKSIKKMKDATAGFDELNIISDNASDVGGGAAVSASNPAEAFKTVDLDFKTDKFAEIGKWLNKYIGPLDSIWTYAKIIGIAFGTWLVLKTIFRLLTGTKNVTSGISADFTGLLNGLGNAAAAIAVLGGMALVINSITKLIDTFAKSGLKLPTVLGLVAGVLGTVTAAFGGMLFMMQSFKPSWESVAGAAVILGGLTLVLYAMSDIINALNGDGASLKKTIAGLTAVMVVIIGTVTALTIASKVLASDPLALVALLAITGALVATMAVMAATLPTILNAVGTFIERVAPKFIQVLERIEHLIVSVVTVLKDSFIDIINTVTDDIGKLSDIALEFIAGFGEAVKKACKSIVAGLQSIVDFIEDLPIIGEIIKLGDAGIKKLRKLLGFESGGYPQQGTLFYANEAGPELVGTIGGRTAVASNNEITGISNAVYSTGEAQVRALEEQNSLLRGILAKTGTYIDGKEIKKSYAKAKRNAGAQIGTGGIVYG